MENKTAAGNLAINCNHSINVLVRRVLVYTCVPTFAGRIYFQWEQY